MSRDELLKGLTPEQVEKAKACKNDEELLKLAKEEGVELTNEQLEAINGGGLCAKPFECPMCHAKGGAIERTARWDHGFNYHCTKCQYDWTED